MTADPQPRPAPDPEPEPREDVLAWLAALADADAPPGEDDYARWPGPGADSGDDTTCPAELAHLSPPELEELLTAVPVPVPEFGPAGMVDRDRAGRRPGFADGGVLDTLD